MFVPGRVLRSARSTATRARHFTINAQEMEDRLTKLQRWKLKSFKGRAAVLVPFCLVNGTPSLLYSKRAETVGTHKGQGVKVVGCSLVVAFPGGFMEETDADLVQTALREVGLLKQP